MTFLALADPTRRAIVACLARGDAAVTVSFDPKSISASPLWRAALATGMTDGMKQSHQQLDRLLNERPRTRVHAVGDQELTD